MKRVLFASCFLCLVFFENRAQFCFSGATTFTSTSDPYAICSEDFNGDGFADLAAANWNSGDVSVLLSNGNGTFGAATYFTVGTKPTAITSADLNTDGSYDLVVVNEGSNDISILLGNGNGNFNSATNFNVGQQPWSSATGDFNEDGALDIVVANYFSNTVSLLAGSGSGSFAAATNIFSGNTPVAIACSDLNNDGHLDMAVASYHTDSISILLGNGLGGFTFLSQYSSGNGAVNGAVWIISDDLNADSYQDLVLANDNYLNDISVLLGSGGGNFAPAVTYGTMGSSVYSVTSGDFDGDGKMDLAASNFSTPSIAVFKGNGSGSFAAPVLFSIPQYPRCVITNDFNGDGKADLATPNWNSNNISVLLNTLTPITISGNTNICLGNSVTLTASGASTYTWSANAGNAHSAAVVLTPTASTTYSVTADGCTNNAATIFVNVSAPTVPNICMVTVDSASGYLYNNVYWDKTLYPAADSFVVFRYDAMSSSYLQIGAVSKDSLSLFTDTAFTIGGPNGGNPIYSSWQYKLAIKDTCGNLSAKSPYHQTMFVQQNGALFSWNAYAVETGQVNPVTGYSFLRDDQNNGNWHILVNTSGTAATDPNYTNFPNGNWRVDALGFNCTATMRLSSEAFSAANKKSHSNTSKPVSIGIEDHFHVLVISPNPAHDVLLMRSDVSIGYIAIYNSLGETVLETKTENTSQNVDVSRLPSGIYMLSVRESWRKFVKD